MISTKISSLKELVGNQLQQRTNAGASSEAFPFAGLISAITKFNDTIIFCDAGTLLTYLKLRFFVWVGSACYFVWLTFFHVHFFQYLTFLASI